MPDPSRLRDSTQIVLEAEALDGLRADLDEQFTVTMVEDDGYVRIIASPVVIKEVSDFLARQGINLP